MKNFRIIIGAFLMTLLTCTQPDTYTQITTDSYEQTQKPADNLFPYIINIDSEQHTIKISRCLLPYVNKFFLDPNIKCLNIGELKNLLYILHSTHLFDMPIGNDVYGVTYRHDRTKKTAIVIHTSVPHFLPTFLEVVILHEIYHALHMNLGHCKGSECPYILLSGDKIDIETVIKTFDDKAKQKYFDYLLKLQVDKNN